MLVFLAIGIEAAAKAQAAAPLDDVQGLLKQGEKLNSEGKQDEALKLYQQVLHRCARHGASILIPSGSAIRRFGPRSSSTPATWSRSSTR